MTPLVNDTHHAPKVSIGMPVYNSENIIKEALDSLVGQTFGNFELIISDNASTDSTHAICREFADRDTRIRYFRHKENRGALKNFQFVLDEAVGEYFMWAAADDRRHSSFIELAAKVLNEDASVGLVFCDMQTENLETNKKISSSIGYSGDGKKYKKYLFRLLHGCPSIIYGLHRIDILRKVTLENFDYFDVYLTHWYELNSVVKTIPLYLYTAGTKGMRIPYSLTGKSLNIVNFLSYERRLLKDHLGFIPANILYLLTWYLYKNQTKKLNKEILL